MTDCDGRTSDAFNGPQNHPMYGGGVYVMLIVAPPETGAPRRIEHHVDVAVRVVARPEPHVPVNARSQGWADDEPHIVRGEN